MNDLHASGAFYAAHLNRFKCEHCAKPAPFLVEVWSHYLQMSQSVCPVCVAQLKAHPQAEFRWKEVCPS